MELIDGVMRKIKWMVDVSGLSSTVSIHVRLAPRCCHHVVAECMYVCPHLWRHVHILMFAACVAHVAYQTMTHWGCHMTCRVCTSCRAVSSHAGQEPFNEAFYQDDEADQVNWEQQKRKYPSWEHRVRSYVPRPRPLAKRLMNVVHRSVVRQGVCTTVCPPFWAEY